MAISIQSGKPSWGWRVCCGLILAIGQLMAGCGTPPPDDAASTPSPDQAETIATAPQAPQDAIILAVEPSGTTGNYRFAVTLQSPDTGCDQYANWWEVVSEDEELLYRRILLHSHVEEQPFTRTGGPIAITADQTVIVRAHMHPSGYGQQAFQGSVANGFIETELPQSFGIDLADQVPLPTDCTF